MSEPPADFGNDPISVSLRPQPKPEPGAAVKDVMRYYGCCAAIAMVPRVKVQAVVNELERVTKENEQLNKAVALKMDALPSGLSAGQSKQIEERLAADLHFIQTGIPDEYLRRWEALNQTTP